MIRSSSRSTNTYARDGAVVVEFALVLPILLLLVFGIIEFGHLFFIRQTMINAAREGARTATLAADDETKETLVIGRVQTVLAVGGLDPANCTITYTSEPAPGSAETVTTTVPYADVSMLGNFLGFMDFDMSATCVMFRTGAT